ncbi:unnamed protein product [Adineta steineri]|uniref:Glycosyltransferase n=1 Tax=Adineta steineri TaxID=433720 RepID=A0A814RDZ7_9BILA|nr:unnamed protein product [Adineta steineri]CAF1201391.1 unnamed protein product [Adineta steineri]
MLILLTVNDLLYGIDLRSFDKEDLNETNRKIPEIIHQMWKTTDLSTYPINNSHNKWKLFYPNYKFILWTDKQIEELILKNDYKYLYSIYKSYFYSIQRADLARLIILHSYGGIYADLDVYPQDTNLDKLILKNASFIIGRSSTDICLVNHFLISEKHSNILNSILRKIFQKSFFNQIYILPYLEVFSTGSIFLTNIIRNSIYFKSLKENSKLIILSHNQLSNYIFHDAGRSWHLFDGYLINQIDAHPKIFFSFLTIFILFIFCFIRFNKFCKIKYRFK